MRNVCLQLEGTWINAYIRSGGAENYPGYFENRDLSDETLKKIDFKLLNIPDKEIDTKEKFRNLLQEHRQKVRF